MHSNGILKAVPENNKRGNGEQGYLIENKVVRGVPVRACAKIVLKVCTFAHLQLVLFIRLTVQICERV